MLYYSQFDSPLGELFLLADEDCLLSLEYLEAYADKDSLLHYWQHRYHRGIAENETPVLLEVKQQLSEYFAGNRVSFDFPMDLSVGTSFQQEVWEGLLTIPYGEVVSYKELARRIGRPRAVRALANANGRNPMSIIVPCHRVIYENGELGGYSSGLDKKEYLLDLEKKN